MNELVFRNNDQAVTSSINVARDFGKRHTHVLEAIDEIKGVAENPADLFFETTYTHEQNKQEYRQYLINKDGFTLLAMGFTGKKAIGFKMDYMSEFNKMEQFLNSPEMIVQRALQIQEGKIKSLETENEKLKPKATYHDLVLQSDSLLSTTSIAKDFGLGAPTLNNLLHELGIQYKKGHRWYLYYNHQDKGYAQSKTHVVSADKTKDHMYWTQKGRLFIYETLKEKKGIIPMVERETVRLEEVI